MLPERIPAQSGFYRVQRVAFFPQQCGSTLGIPVGTSSIPFRCLFSLPPLLSTATYIDVTAERARARVPRPEFTAVPLTNCPELCGGIEQEKEL